MKRSTFSEEQIVYAIRQADASTPVGDLCRQLGVSAATFYAWKKKYAYLGVSELRRLRQVEEENSRLKRFVAEPSMVSLVKDRDHDRPRWITGRNSNLGRSKIGPIGGTCSSTSFGPANRWKMPSLSRLTLDCEMNV